MGREYRGDVRGLLGIVEFRKGLTRIFEDSLGKTYTEGDMHRVTERLERIGEDIKRYADGEVLDVVTLGSSGRRDWEECCRYGFIVREIPYRESNLDKAPRASDDDRRGFGEEYRKFRTNPADLPVRRGGKVLIVDKSIKSGYTINGALVYLLENFNPSSIRVLVTADHIGMANYALLSHQEEGVLGTFTGLRRTAPRLFREVREKVEGVLSDDVFDPTFIRYAPPTFSGTIGKVSARALPSSLSSSPKQSLFRSILSRLRIVGSRRDTIL